MRKQGSIQATLCLVSGNILFCGSGNWYGLPSIAGVAMAEGLPVVAHHKQSPEHGALSNPV